MAEPNREAAVRARPESRHRTRSDSTELLARGAAARTIDVLRRVRLFEELDDEATERLASYARSLTTTKGQLVIARGDPGDALFVIRRGRFKVATADAAGRHLTLGVLGPAEVFGEIALVDGRARSADVVSLGTGSLLAIDRSRFVGLVRTHPTLGWTLTNVVARRLRRLTERLEDRAFLDLERRLAKRLIEAAEDVGASRDGYLMPGISVGFTQQELAEIVDASRERVNRQLATWSRDGYVEIARSRIRLLDPAALRRVFEDEGPHGVRS